MPAHLKHTITDRINAAAKRYQGVPDPMSIPAIRNELINLYALGSITMAAHTILFSSEQAEVFAGLAEGYTESLEYALPFEQVLLEFTEPVPWGDRQLLGIALSHDEYDQAEFESFAAERNMIIEQPAQPLADHTELHYAIAVYADEFAERIAWRVDDRQILFDDRPVADAAVKNLAIACIGYINCENVTLERHAVDERINRKRVRKGKKPLEPYYTCHIRGVSYAGEGAGTGAKHGIRYDVRGHFRRLATGKTIWVRAHQRGLANELYVPKVYKVD